MSVADDSKTADASAHERSDDVKVVDAGPAPVDHIRQARPAALEETVADRQAIDAGPVRVVSERMKTDFEVNVPLNPLRAGAAVARAARRVEAMQQFQNEPEGADGGSAPKHGAD